MIEKDGTPLTDLDSWRDLAGPKRAVQWQDDRSAKECARAWLTAAPAGLPPEVRDSLLSHPDFGSIREWCAEPEARVRFDRFGGEPSNLDMLVVASDHSGLFVVGVEAKADESFGATVSEVLARARDRKASNPRSRGVDRVRGLLDRILGLPVSATEAAGIRYQLLTATAATLSETGRRGASRAVLMIQEFITDRTTDLRHDQNAADLNAFVALLSRGAVRVVRPGELIGPFAHSHPKSEVQPPLYVGKAVKDLRSGGA